MILKRNKMSQMLSAKVKEIEELLILMHEPASLDALVRVGQGEKPLSDLIPGEDGRKIVNDIHEQSLYRALSEYLSQLPEMQRKVVKLIHMGEKTRHEVAEILGIESHRVTDIDSKALRNLRLKMRHDPRFSDYAARSYYHKL